MWCKHGMPWYDCLSQSCYWPQQRSRRLSPYHTVTSLAFMPFVQLSMIFIFMPFANFSRYIALFRYSRVTWRCERAQMLSGFLSKMTHLSVCLDCCIWIKITPPHGVAAKVTKYFYIINRCNCGHCELSPSRSIRVSMTDTAGRNHRSVAVAYLNALVCSRGIAQCIEPATFVWYRKFSVNILQRQKIWDEWGSCAICSTTNLSFDKTIIQIPLSVFIHKCCALLTSMSPRMTDLSDIYNISLTLFR